MKKTILLASVVLISATSIVSAVEAPKVQLETRYVSRYIWRGFDVYNRNHSAFQPSIDIDWYGTGWGTRIFSSRANGSGFENCEELDFTLYYGNSFWQGNPCVTDYEVGWTYYTFPDQPARGTCRYPAADMQEVYTRFSWPEALPAGFVPQYTVIRLWPSRSDSHISGYGGWMHIFGLRRDVTTGAIMPNTEQQVWRLGCDIVYNDGITRACRSTYHSGCGGSGWTRKEPVDHDWSHAVFSVTTDIPVDHDVIVTPGIFWQSSWEDSVNASDEFWFGVDAVIPLN